MTRRPDKRAVANYVAALKKYGVPPLAVWRRYSLRTRAAAIYRYCNGRDIPLRDLADTPAARRRPRDGDL